MEALNGRAVGEGDGLFYREKKERFRQRSKAFKLILTDALGATGADIVGVADALQLAEAGRPAEEALEEAPEEEVDCPLDRREAVQQGEHGRS